jgi:hypothetical protein
MRFAIVTNLTQQNPTKSSYPLLTPTANQLFLVYMFLLRHWTNSATAQKITAQIVPLAPHAQYLETYGSN